MASLTRPGKSQSNPRANVFLLVNLGCEMLYVIDQRLQAQTIAAEKSMQVLHEITAVLLEPKFIDSLIIGSTHVSSQLLTVEHCRFMLNDIAMCSLMRLDAKSMDKLWNLMTMVYKWQLYVSRHQHHLLDITFRHLDGVAQLYGETSEKHRLLVDFTKNTLLDFWNSASDDEQLTIYRTNKRWLECFNTKISLLIRLGLQAPDGSFVVHPSEQEWPPQFEDFAQTIGVNVYEKASLLATSTNAAGGSSTEAQDSSGAAPVAAYRRLDQLAELLSGGEPPAADSDDLQPIDVNAVQRQFEASLQQCNIIFADLEKDASKARLIEPKEEEEEAWEGNEKPDNLLIFPVEEPLLDESVVRGEFVQVRTIHTRPKGPATGGGGAGRGQPAVRLNQDLLNLYSGVK